MTWTAALLRPALDALAPEERAAAHRRVRNLALWLSLSAWLLPEFDALGTGTIGRRTVLCATFAAAALAAQVAGARPWGAKLTLAASAVAAAVVAWAGHGALWGMGFLAFAAATLGLSSWRAHLVRLPPSYAEPDPLPPLPGGLPRLLHVLGLIGVSVLFLRAFAGQAMVVPTGSMQPTIMGAAGRNAPGDHVFVESFPYLFRDPRRFEIVVFEFPLFRPRYFVKRLVGLPGEHLEIKNGDLWVNGKVARKPPLVQATLWRELFPRPSPGSKAKAINEGFQQDPSSSGTWTRLSEREVRGVPEKDPTYAFFFNVREGYPDVRLAVTAVPDGTATVLARVTTRGVPVSLSLRAGGTPGESHFDVGNVKTTIPDVASAGAGGLRVELCVADGEAWALVDGVEVARAPVPVDGRGRNRIEIGASGGPVSFRDVVVARDIVYDTGGGPGVWDVPNDGFFFIGDNVLESDDSRKWEVEVFHPPGGGPPIRAAASVPDESGNMRGSAIRVEGGMYRFQDVDAVPRVLPVEGTRVEHGVPWPFARRSHLVGRAVLVFWPWAPADAGFRPRLLP